MDIMAFLGIKQASPRISYRHGNKVKLAPSSVNSQLYPTGDETKALWMKVTKGDHAMLLRRNSKVIVFLTAYMQW